MKNPIHMEPWYRNEFNATVIQPFEKARSPSDIKRTKPTFIYYAHSKQIYNTERERKELSFIRSSFPLIPILNPSKNMDQFGLNLKQIAESWAIVCSRYENHVGKGVYEEIKEAIRLKKPVFCIIQPNKLVRVRSLQLVDPNHWKTYYGKLLI